MTPPPELSAEEFASSGRLREAIAAALGVEDPAILDDVEADFRGFYRSPIEYIRDQLRQHLPPFIAWILDCCDNDRLRQRYEAGKITVWTLPHPTERARILVFESPRTK